MHADDPAQLGLDLGDHLRGALGDDGDTAQVPCMVHFGHGQAFDVITSPGKQPDDTGQHSGLVIDQDCQRVPFFHIRKGGAQIIGGMAGGAFLNM